MSRRKSYEKAYSYRKRKRTKLLREIRDKENEALKDRTVRAVFYENESLGSYNRKRKTCFKQSSTPKRPKSHTPNFDNVSWDKHNHHVGQINLQLTGV